jgi:hypothetical protein
MVWARHEFPGAGGTCFAPGLDLVAVEAARAANPGAALLVSGTLPEDAWNRMARRYRAPVSAAGELAKHGDDGDGAAARS